MSSVLMQIANAQVDLNNIINDLKYGQVSSLFTDMSQLVADVSVLSSQNPLWAQALGGSAAYSAGMNSWNNVVSQYNQVGLSNIRVADLLTAISSYSNVLGFSAAAIAANTGQPVPAVFGGVVLAVGAASGAMASVISSTNPNLTLGQFANTSSDYLSQVYTNLTSPTDKINFLEEFYETTDPINITVIGQSSSGVSQLALEESGYVNNYDLTNVSQALAAENEIIRGHNSGYISDTQYLSLSQLFSQALTMNNNVYQPTYSIPLTLDPIGAFYEVKSVGTDNSVSIANKTGVLLNAQRQGMSTNVLTALDGNGDGKLAGTELSGLQVWYDTNQNGMQEAGEVQGLAQAGISQVRSSDYSFYTGGNSVATTGPAVNPVAAAVAALPTSVNLIQAAPASNFRSLRDTDNVYWVNSYQYIAFGSNQIKINNGNRSYLIGTDGNDTFDANYYAAYSAYFTTPLTNFLAGGGDDLMGGSVRNDNLWGGTGNDTLLGYAGDDKLYGEEGADEIQGNEGNDYLDGGIGNDRLFGQVGNDTLVGGDGADFMMGFTGTNDAKQTLLAGETDNDYLYGGNGNDTLVGGLGSDYLDGGADVDFIEAGQGDDIAFGGAGNDEMHGNEGNDKLSGDAGDDLMFGSVGNDQIWGGDGNDVLVGFTPTNDVKQSLAAGETDNDVIYGGAGNDQIYGGLGSDYEDGGIGTDIVDGGDGADTLFGGADDDEVNGGAGNDVLSGDAGADKVFGGVGNDQIWGGDGNDILVGFTATNEAKQTLLAGETDDDIIDGGAGDDLIMGGFGADQLFGGIGLDELQGGEGNDQLYGNDGNDRLFGGAGNDVIYGGAGDDLIVGGAGDNEPALAAGVSDGNWLYGGEGNDTIVGGIGNDYVDGGLGADNMQGGTGNDTYIVNSVNDVILEQVAQGYDTVISSANYILNANIEELRLVEGFNINGTGNSLNNRIIGNSADNILDGVTGADTMMGGLGNDTYYVDNVGDQIVEYAGEGVDTVQSKISVSLGDNLENLNLLDFSKPEKGLVDGVSILVYGYPKANELDYMQGDAVAGYKGTCALTSIANLMTQANMPTSEAQVVNLAIQNNWVVSSPTATDYQRGGSNYVQQRAILTSYGIANTLLAGYNPEAIANLVQSGRGVIIGLNAGKLWNDPNYNDAGTVNHVVTITGAVRNASTGALMGFYIADSGRQQVSDMTRYLSLADLQVAANVADAYAIYTTEALKLWNEDINGTGNSLDNTVIGNRGNNVLFGAAGTDTLMGAQGSDTYLMQRGQGNDVVVDSDATIGNNDVISLAANISSDQLWFSHVGNDLKISVIGTNDSYTVKDWYVGSSNQVEQIKAANGKTLSNTHVDQLVQAMSTLAAPTAGTTSLPTNYQTALNPVIAANWQ